MEIIKVFSEIDTDERLYSVILDEDEVELFSEFQKEFGKYGNFGYTVKLAEEMDSGKIISPYSYEKNQGHHMKDAQMQIREHVRRRKGERDKAAGVGKYHETKINPELERRAAERRAAKHTQAQSQVQSPASTTQNVPVKVTPADSSGPKVNTSKKVGRFDAAKNWMKTNPKATKGLAIGTSAAALTAGGLYLGKKLKDKKKKKN